MSNARGPDATGSAAVDGSGPAGPLSREAQARAVQKALALVSEKQPAWTRHDLVKQLALVMPAESRRMSARAARELLLGLAEEALSGRGGDVVCLEAPEWPPLPASLRRELDGRSVFTRPGTARYATAAQLSAEERLVAHAQGRRAPRLPGELAARRLGVDAELVAGQLRERAQDAHQQATRSGLRLDQAAAVWHVLTSADSQRRVSGGPPGAEADGGIPVQHKHPAIRARLTECPFWRSNDRRSGGPGCRSYRHRIGYAGRATPGNGA